MFSVTRLLVLFRKWLWLLLLGVALGAGVAGGLSLRQSPVYRASTKILISPPPKDESVLLSGVDNKNLPASYAEYIVTEPMLNAVETRLGYPVRAANINVNVASASSILTIQVENRDPQAAADIANALVAALLDLNAEFQTSQYTAAEASIQAQISEVQTRLTEVTAQTQQSGETDLDAQAELLAARISDLHARIAPLEVLNLSLRDPLVLAALDSATADENLRQASQNDLEINFLRSQLTGYETLYLQTILARDGFGSPPESSLSNTSLLLSQVGLYERLYSELLANLEGVRLARLENTPTISQLEKARPANSPLRPRPLADATVGAAAGLLVVILIVYAIEFLDDRLKTEADVRRVFDAPVIGYIPANSELEKSSGVYVLENQQTPLADAFRSLRVNLEFIRATQPLKTLGITSLQPEDGKSTIASNLAGIFSIGEQRIGLVDADLRRPSQATIFGYQDTPGLTDIFLGGEFADYLAQWQVSQYLHVIPSGPLPPNPMEILISPKVQAVLERLGKETDMVMVDSPPLGVPDALVLAAKMDGVLLVIRPGSMRTATAIAIAGQLRRAEVRLVGIVLNQVDQSEAALVDYYYSSDRPAHKSSRRAKGK